jgi:TonB family protein
MKYVQRVVLALVATGLFAASASAAQKVVPCRGGDGEMSASAAVPAASKTQNRWRYPSEAWHQRAEGTVLLRVELDAAGAATHVNLAQSSGSNLLDRAALKAARSSRFCKREAPAEAMSGLAEVSVSYSLNVAVARL